MTQCLVLFFGYVHVRFGLHILVHPPNHTDSGHSPNYIDARNPPNHTNDGCHPSHLKLFVSIIFFMGFQKRPSFAVVVLRICWPRIFAINGGLLNCGVVASSYSWPPELLPVHRCCFPRGWPPDPLRPRLYRFPHGQPLNCVCTAAASWTIWFFFWFRSCVFLCMLSRRTIMFPHSAVCFLRGSCDSQFDFPSSSCSSLFLVFGQFSCVNV